MARALPEAAAAGSGKAAGEDAQRPYGWLGGRRAVAVFAAFALAYFISNLARAITATLSPTLAAEFGLDAGQLGLLAGGYFLGFALTQLPMGHWLDLHGPKRVILSFLCVAVLGCLLFSVAGDFGSLLAARILTGVGVSACLMAPLTGYRRWFAPAQQLRSTSWMLTVGSVGMVGSTLPVQWLLPHLGWRPLFGLLALGALLAMLAIAWAVPAWTVASSPSVTPPAEGPPDDRGGGYAAVWRDPFFRALAPLGMLYHGGFLALQTLWLVPWFVRVEGQTPAEAAYGLFTVNLAQLASFWAWGALSPWLLRRGWAPARLIAVLVPLSLGLLAVIVVAGPVAGAGLWTALCVSTSAFALAQPAVAMALPEALAGRALSAFNFMVFMGVFVAQWGIGLLINAGIALGQSPEVAFRMAIGAYGLSSGLAYLHFLRSSLPSTRSQPSTLVL